MSSRGRVLDRYPTAIPGCDVIRYDGRDSLYARIRCEAAPNSKAKYKYVNKSLETADLTEAQQKAAVQYALVVQDPDKFSRTTITKLAKLVDEYCEFQRSRVLRGEITESYLDTIERSMYKGFLPFCLNNRISRVMDVAHDSFQFYGAWRMDAFTLEPGTVNSEIRLFKGFLIWCQKVKSFFPGYFWFIPPVRKKAGGKKANSAYTKEMSEEMFKFVVSQTENEEISPHQRWLWKLYSQYWALMLDSGMRTSEPIHIQWKHVRIRGYDPEKPDDFMNCECDVHVPISKTGPRDTIIQTPVFILLKKMYEKKGRSLTPEDYLFNHVFSGKQMTTQTFTGKFAEVRAKFGYGDEYTLYSSRSTYITERIIAGVPISMIAKNVGHSERVLSETYEDVILKRNADVMLQRRNAPYLKGEQDPDAFLPLV